MDKQQAQQIIRDTFESSFDKSGFTSFIKNLLNRIDDAPFIYHGNYIPDVRLCLSYFMFPASFFLDRTFVMIIFGVETVINGLTT